MSVPLAERTCRTWAVPVRQVLIRHGESYANVEERYQGQSDTGLTPDGSAQAAALARRLVAAYPEVADVVGSDLGRVVDTAAPYLALTGARMQPDKRLRELDTGAWSGRRIVDVAREFPHVAAAMAAGEDPRRGGDGETFAELRERVRDGLDEHARRVAGGVDAAAGPVTTLVFTHGGVIRVAVADALGLPAGGHLLVTPPSNCSITVVTRHVDAAGRVRQRDLVTFHQPTGAARASRAE